MSAASALLLVSFFIPAAAMAAQYTLVIKNHRFSPNRLTVPANERVKLVIDNRDATVEEFESHDLHREKLVPGHSKSVVWVGPLGAGTYHFYGEFHKETAHGALIVK
ncbi:cupredoxin domain-containing protein [Acidihalobacter ferrooxydans]|uniref:EfeO-type cupredoxin-like domain-containing protein n=1 Tax=Acidihalobacter ferrooxydans TaxID=1765967 RepID=A0A1P8UJZ5_9GAMM|nr:cupredoxin domain-containing protein [Acidihalobacter ferrooxydans]APZ44151.1 hypothetical protein BW247_14490 [Acidihalobacter ferrooxydans]